MEIYLDNASTTPVDPRVLEAMLPYFTEEYGNAESLHTKGQNARVAVDNARETIAKILNCSSDEIIFTSGGTESNNLAIFGAARANSKKGKHLIVSSVEHSSVRAPFKKLEEEGYEVTWLKVDKEGFINQTEVATNIRPETIFVSVMYANNEIGTIEPIAKIGKICRAKGVIFHTDACQAADSYDLDVEKLQVDMMTINASKVYGPKGAGVLYVKRGIKIEPLILGSTHENGLRAGTHNVPGIVGLGKAVELAIIGQAEKNTRLVNLRNKLIKGVLEKMPGSQLNGPNPFDPKYANTACPRLPNNTNFTFKGIEGQDLLLQLDNLGIYIGTGAACTVRTSKPSNVLHAIGLSSELIQSSVRMTLSKNTSETEIDHVLEILPGLIKKMRKRG
ncbi:cysteine desulfurase [Candidatus Peregrinibacteria bacterium]|nr:cysteine desulfurase [Candidatus Peregrinibacteria bacterium]